MFTRRTATVTMSAPEASCACAMTACDEYLPVPTISRDVNVRPAMVKVVSAIAKACLCVSVLCGPSHRRARLAAADEVHDLDAVAVTDERRRERMALENHEIVLDGDAPRIDLERSAAVLRTDNGWSSSKDSPLSVMRTGVAAKNCT